jgi:predicted phosphodiesterase
VRGLIRFYVGQNGVKDRKTTVNKKFFRPAGKCNPFEIPSSECDVWKPVHIAEKSGLIFSDSHMPYHDKVAMDAMVDYTIKKRNIDFILINGDGLDFYQLSKYQKDPSKRSLNDEIWMWVGFLLFLQKIFPKVKIYWKLGNHEERLEKYLRVKAPELLDMEEFNLKNIIQIRGVEGVTVIEKQIIYAGRLPIVHSHEYQNKTTSQVNPARGLFLKSLSSVLGAHSHVTSSHSETDINGKLMSTFSIGCLCGLHPEYALLNRWNHGFASIDIDKKEFSIENMKIFNGSVYHA